MANVPYDQGVADVAPQSGGTGATYGDVPQANAAAFGGGIGEAEQGVGQQTNQLAQKFADIYNESTARDAATKTVNDMADEQNRFMQLKGNAAVAGFKQHQDNLNQIMKNNADGLSLNANSMYQKDASSIYDRTLMVSGAHVGEQAEQAHTNALTGAMGASTNLYTMNATNPTGDANLADIVRTSGDLSNSLGYDPATAANAAAKATGLAIDAAVKANIKTNPDAAAQILNSHLGTYNHEDVDPVTGKMVTTQRPWMDAAQRAQTISEMQGEFQKQANDLYWDAAHSVTNGSTYDKPALAAAMTRAGKTQTDIDAHMLTLDNMRDVGASSAAAFTVEQAIKNGAALATDGFDVPPLDPVLVKTAYPKDPARQQFALDTNATQRQVSTVSAQRGTLTRAQNYAAVDAIAPKDMSIADSIHQQESGGRANAPANGVSVGGWQITPGTFAQYAKPGEDINNPKDNEAVGRRIIDDLSTKFNGDPARIAVGYFSGAGNVAPAGSATPWINDTSDKNGKTVSSYVADVTGRMDGSRNYAMQNSAYNLAMTTMDGYYKLLDKDPAGTINGDDKNLAAKFQDAVQDTKNPQKMNDYISAIQQRQDFLQIPKENQSVLPRAYAAAVQKDLAANPEAAPDKLAKMAKDYGNNWPQVYKSLGLTFQQQTQAHTAEDPMMAQYGAMDAKLGSDDLTKGKTDEFIMGGKENLKAMKDAVTSNTDLQSFMLSMRRSGASPQYLQQIQDQAEHMSMAIKFYDPAAGSIGDAVNKAVGAMTHGYGYLPSGDRVPLSKIDSISTNTQFYQQHIGDLVSPQQYVPPTYASREHYIQDLQTSSSFLTDEANQRLLMIDNHGLPVLGLDGKQISVGFNDAAMRKPVVRPPDLVAQPNQNLGRGEIPVKGSLADKMPSFSEIPGIAESAGRSVVAGVENLAAKAKERESQGGLAATPNANVGVGATPRKGSIADIINEAIK